MLYASAKAELRKRYAGTLLGSLWPVLYPLMFLGAYLFVWLVVVGVRYPGFGRVDYVVFVFGGLVPFLYLMDCLTSGAVVIRQNIQLVKSVIMPVELIVTRTVLVGFIGHLVGVALLVALGGVNGNLTWRVALLPVVLVVQLMGLIGLVWLVAPLGLIVPDVGHLLGVCRSCSCSSRRSHSGPTWCPDDSGHCCSSNPVTYMVGAYRWTIIGPAAADGSTLIVFGALAGAAFVLGGLFCWRFKGFVVDFE